MQHLILLAVVSMMVFYVLIIVGCLCYVGAARADKRDVSVTFREYRRCGERGSLRRAPSVSLASSRSRIPARRRR